ncbi:MAG: T9SS type A sorting domain-containing protein [bacterium]
MLIRSITLALLVSSVSAFAQTRPLVVQNQRGGVLYAQQADVRSMASQDTISVLAVMVDFQADTDTMTTGNGKFQLSATSVPLIDPPPHDSSYFSDKLRFLTNYFRKVSNGKVNIKSEVFGKVITLPQKMSSYSPPKDGSNEKLLADFVVASWRIADSLFPQIQFSKYQAFVLFHAGVGRDFDLVSLLGSDPTPFDIPSITFNLNLFRKYLKNPGFAGIPVDGGTRFITNSLILPETESRPIRTISRLDTLQLSVNGLLANSFGSFLGLPDLFDTKTGRTAIGAYGLMDGASIGTFNGLFPPEPSAWEKVHLGWVQPITVPDGLASISLPAVGLTQAGMDTIYKVPISDSEYFLIENRSRDPQMNGQHITVRQGSSLTTVSFMRDSTGFITDDASRVSGSVIDVEDFDWALPGYIGAEPEFHGGGILIWHIDEDVIQRGLETNEVNADPDHRGVDLEEADGAQDIGRTYGITEPGVGTENGWALDYWFSENIAIPYRNSFDKNSFPNSNSYTGAKSLVSMTNFSGRSPRMTVLVQRGDVQITRLTALTKQFSPSANPIPPTVFSRSIACAINNNVYLFTNQGTSRTKDPTGQLASKGGQFAPAGYEAGTNGLVLVGAQDSSIVIWNLTDNNNDLLYESIRDTVITLDARISTPPMITDIALLRAIIVGTERGTVWQLSVTGSLIKKISTATLAITSIGTLPSASLSRPYELFWTAADMLYSEQSSFRLPDASLPWMLIGVGSAQANYLAVAQKGGRRITGVDRSLGELLFDNNLPSGSIHSLSAADIDADGSKDIVVNAGTELYALNRSGVVLSGFPVKPRTPASIAGNELLADVNGDSFTEIVSVDSNGVLYAWDRRGKNIDSFPLQLSGRGTSLSALFETAQQRLGLLALSSSGAMNAIEFKQSYRKEIVHWGQYLADANHHNGTGSVDSVRISPSQEFFPKAKVYNWPNPVYGSSTQIRFSCLEAADVRVKILDLAGTLIAELQGHALAGIESELTWNVSNIQSGIYLARVEAIGSNKRDVVIIKIAVVK